MVTIVCRWLHSLLPRFKANGQMGGQRRNSFPRGCPKKCSKAVCELGL